MKIRPAVLSLTALLAGLGEARLPAQDVIIGEPGWFQSEGAPDHLPQAKGQPKVEYPDVLLTSDETSYVILARYLDDKGHGLMMDAHSTHPWFKRAVEEAMDNWPMRPARLGDKPVPSWFWIPIIFNPVSASPKRADAKPRLLAVTPVILPEAMMIKLRDKTEAWGTVSLDAAGVPQKVSLEPPASDKLLPLVETALKQWHFDPARKGGQPVAGDFRVAFHFFSAMAPVPAKATPPRVASRQAPVYPYSQRRRGFTGTVEIAFVVDSRGRVQDAEVLRSNNPAFNDAAVTAVRAWRFDPGMVDGRPVNTRMTVPIIFDFSGDDAQQPGAVKPASRQAQQQLPEELRYDVAPRSRAMITPVYPYSLLQSGTTGKATAVFQIDAEGRVVGVKVAEATHPEFGLALAAAVERFQFDPALKEGKPTSTILKIEQDFSRSALLSDEEGSLLRREKRHPESIVDAAKLDTPLQGRKDQPPAFPLALRGKVDRGMATVELLVDEDGSARLPRVVEASEPAFGYAAVQAASQWKFSPPKTGGKPAVARLVVPVIFETRPAVMGTAVGEPPGDRATK